MWPHRNRVSSALPTLAFLGALIGWARNPEPSFSAKNAGTMEPTRSYASTTPPISSRGNPTPIPILLIRANGTPRSSPELWGTSWLLVDLEGSPALAGIEQTLAFPEPGKVAGKGACNRFFGTAKISGETLTITQIASTQMACLGSGMGQEGKYFKALAAAQRYSLEGNTLLIYTAGSDRPLRFTRKA